MTYSIKSIQVPLLFFMLIISSPGQDKLHEKQLQKGFRNSGEYHAWIYFTDKGLETNSKMNSALQLVLENLAEKTKQRRSKTRGSILVDERDIPVHDEYIESIRNSGLSIRTTSKWLNAVSVSGSLEQLNEITAFEFVQKIDPVYGGKRTDPVKISPGKSTENLDRNDYGASFNQLEQINVIAAHEAGYTGAGIRILMLDTGYYTDHEAIPDDQVFAEWDFINNDGETQNEDGDHESQHNHGTYTLSALGGKWDGELYGPAYEAEFLLAKTEDVTQEVPIEEDQYVAGLEWGEGLGADIASSSLGYMDWYQFEDLDGLTAVTTIAVNIAIENGMIVTTAAGNYGSDGIIAPADAFDVITCGAVDEFDEITWFSSWGPTADGRTKPEVCARGLDTYCALPPEYGGGYGGVSGTSLSTPLIGGACALILNAHPDWTPQQVREALMMTASDPENPDNQYGWGIIDVMAAIDYSFPEMETYWQILELPQGYERQISTNGQNRVITAGLDIGDMQFHIYFSDDTGDTWFDIPIPNTGFVTAEDILLTDDNNIYVPDFAYGVFHSSDFGQTWTSPGEFTPEGCAAFNIHSTGVMFAGLSYSGIGFIHRSEDQGETWTAIPLPDYSSNYAVEHIHFNSQGHVYLGTINGVYRSTDVGLTWEKVNSGLDGVKVATMTIDAEDDIYIQTTNPGLYDGYYRSQDSGDTWQALDFYDHIGWSMEFLSIDGSFYAIGSDNGVSFSDDGGVTWTQINDGFESDESNYLLYDLDLGGNGYLYLTGRYVYRSDEPVTEPVYDGPVWHISTTGSDETGDGSEENPFATIQHGIDVSSDGDSVLVSSGTYLESIDYSGKNIAVIGEDRETTIIDGNQSGSVVIFDSIVGSTAVLAGFTITGGNAYDGGGIYCTSSAPTIRDNIITGNVSETYGGGISCNYSSAVIINNTITSNSAYYGGGISFDRYTSSVIKGNNITGNSAEEGGGIGCFTFSSPSITNNTISGNSASTNGGGVYCYYVSSPTVTNTIIWDNTAPTDPNISVYSADPLFNYCDVMGGWEGEGNIDIDPLFLDSENGDFTLQEGSPCIDAGTPFFVWEGDTLVNISEDEYNGIAPDMGAFESEFTAVIEGSVWHISTTGSDETGDGSEENPFATIQHGIEVASDGDTVLVHPGTFYGPIDFLGKSIVLGSLYILEENESYIDETILSNFVNISLVPDSELNGFTFQDIYLSSEDGPQAIIYIEDASPVIINNRFDNFYLFQGVESAVIYCENSNSLIMNNVFTNGSVGNGYVLGGYILSKNSSLTIKNNRMENGYVGFADPSGYIVSVNSENIIESNTITNASMGYCYTCAAISIVDGSNCIIRNNLITQAYGDGYGAVVASESQYVSHNNTFVSNSVGYANLSSDGIVSNDIIYGSSNTVYIDENSSIEISFSNIEGGWEGEGNIDADPLFVAPDSGDFHLQSNSPCIDTGDPESPLDSDGTIADMGAYYFHQSPCDSGFVEIEGICFNSDDIAVLQEFIDNSSETINYYFDDPDSWFWNIIDGESYHFADGNGVIEPIEIGLQEWENGRLTSLMCGAYIYCDLSGEIPENINYLTEIQQLRLEYNHLSGLIPETICELDVIMEDDLEFDISGNDLCPPYPECIENYVGYQDTTNCFSIFTMDYQLDWNLVGLPLVVEDASYTVLFPESIEGTLYSFNGGYISETYLDQGEGYWLRFDNAGSSTITGVPINELTISLNEGWNLISGLSGDVSIYSISDPDTIILPGTLYGFDGGYVETDMLVPGNGYWVRAYQTGDITLSSGALSKINPHNFSLNGKANTLSINDSELFFGVELSGREKLSYSLPPKPPEGAFDVRFAGDMKYCENYGEIEVMSNQDKLDVSYTIKTDEIWQLMNPNSKQEWVLEGSGSISILEATEKLILQKQEILPRIFSLNQNFPNPFNPTTMITYELPKETWVNISVFSITGQKVKTILSNNTKAGKHEVIWDGTGTSGLPVSSGMYFYKLDSDEYTSVKKMVLLR